MLVACNKRSFSLASQSLNGNEKVGLATSVRCRKPRGSVVEWLSLDEPEAKLVDASEEEEDVFGHDPLSTGNESLVVKKLQTKTE